MNTPSTTAPAGGIFNFLRRAEAWLDAKGKPAWIAAMVLGFIFVWPVGLALLGYMIWSKRMFGRSNCAQRRADHMARHFGHHAAMRTSGNVAFDSYKADMLRRLEDEQTAFESFLQRLRDAKDKSEFDSFMEDRARTATQATVSGTAAEAPRTGEY
jgi:hypothetical protein